MSPDPSLQLPEQLAAGDHACIVFDDERLRAAAIARFVDDGLRARERVLYIAEGRDAGAVAVQLRAAGIDSDRYIAADQLRIADSAGMYLAGGRFDPAAMKAALATASDDARANGFSRLRVTGDMSWAAAGAPGSDRLLEYERDVDRLLRDTGTIALCQYDRRRFGAEAAAAAAGVHRSRIGSLLHDAPQLRIIGGGGILRLAGEIDIAVVDALRAALGVAGSGSALTVELDELDFIDVTGLHVLQQHALEHGVEVVAKGARGCVARALATLQLDRMRWLRLAGTAEGSAA